jgi:hypothetical protein
MFKVPPPVPAPVQESASNWQEYPIEDFGGGLNTAEPTSSLSPNQFTTLRNFYLTDNNKVRSRGPFRPWLVSSEDTILPDSAPPLTFTIVELRGSDYRVASWDSGSNIEVSVYDEGNNRWAGEGGGTTINGSLADATTVRFAKFSVNNAEDLLYANGSDVPQRWIGTVDTAGSNLGLTAPVDASLTISNVTAANPGQVTTSTAHGLSNGDVIFITGVVGDMGTDVLNDNPFTVTVVDTTNFTIGTDTSGKTYTSGGVVHTIGILTTAASTSGGQGITLNGTYYYKLTYTYDDSGTSTKFGESGALAFDSINVTGAAAATPQKVTLLGMDFPSGVSAVNLYRSQPDDETGTYRLVGTQTTANTDLIDVTPVGAEGDEPPADDGTPPRLKNIAVHGERVWGIGLNAAGALTNKGVWSRKNSPDFYGALDFAYFPDALTGPMPFRRDLYWFTEKQIYVTPDADPETNPDPIKVCDIGCDSYDSIVDVGNGLCWQYDGNIYWANFNDFNPVTGDLPWPIGEPIRDKIADIPAAQRSKTTAEFHNDRAYFSFPGPNQIVNTSTLVWDVKHGSLMLRKGLTGGWTTLSWAANDMKSWNGTLYTLDNTNKYIMEHDFAGTADFLNKTDFDASTSQNISASLVTGDLHFGHEWAEKIINSISMMIQSVGTTYDVTLDFDGSSFQRTKQFVLGTGTITDDATWLIWDQGTWGNFNWASEGSTSTGSLQSDHKRIQKGGKGRYVKMTLETSNAGVNQIVLVKLYFKALPQPA